MPIDIYTKIVYIITIAMKQHKPNKRADMKNLEIRYQKAIKEIGGAAELLNLPRQIQEVLKNTTDFETKVKMFEEIAKAK